MAVKWFQNLPRSMKQTRFWIELCFFYAIVKSALTIDCYDCSSQAGSNKECEDQFVKDVATAKYISRDCFYGYWRANYCIKLKGVREDGTTIIVRQCAVKDWGSHCGLIQFESPSGLEDVDGCLETCDYDGCNLATTIHTIPALCLSVISVCLAWFMT